MDSASPFMPHNEDRKTSSPSAADPSRPRYKSLAPRTSSTPVSNPPLADPEDESPPPVDLIFVNFTDPLQSKSQESRKLVRTQVMRNFTRERRKQKIRGDAGETAFSNLQTPSQQNFEPMRSTILFPADSPQYKSEYFGSDEVIPWTASPPSSGDDSLWRTATEPLNEELKNQCFSPNFRATDPLYMISLLTRRGGSERYPLNVDIDSVTDNPESLNSDGNLVYSLAENTPSLAHAILTVSASDLALRQVNNAANNHLTVYHRSKALSLLNESIQSIEALGLLGKLATVAVLACHELVVGDYKAWSIHMLGFSRMIAMNGGIGSLDRENHIRQLVLWSDQMGALFMNMRPLFQASEIFSSPSTTSQVLSTHFTPQYSATGFQALQSWRRMQADGKLSFDLLRTIEDVETVAFVGAQTILDSRAIIEITQLIDMRNQIIHRLLYQSPQSHDGGDEYSLEECVRLTMLLITLDRLFSPVLPGAYFRLTHMVADRLAALVLGYQLDNQWMGYEWAAMWICFIGTSVSTNSSATRNSFVGAAASLWMNISRDGDFSDMAQVLEENLSAHQRGQRLYGSELIQAFAADLKEMVEAFTQ